MKRIFLIIILTSFTGLFSCAQLSPETQEKLDSVLDSSTQGHYQNTDRQQLWQAGQWSLYKTSSITRDGVFYLFDSNHNTGFVQILVAAAEADSFWLELRLVANDKEQHIAALITEELMTGDLMYQVKQLQFNDHTHIRHFSQSELLDGACDEQLNQVNKWLNLINHSMYGKIQRNVNLPRGEFLHIREVPITISLRLGQMSGYAWYPSFITPIA